MEEISKYIGNKIKYYRTRKNVTQQELADYLGTTSQTISRYESGKLESNNIVLFKLADYFNISINDFFPPLSFDNASVIDINSNIVKIPVYGSIKAGIPIESQPDIIDYIDIPKEWTKGGKKFYGLKISGDSMFPKYQDEDIVIFEQTNDTALYNGKDCAIMINGTESTFKKVLINEQGIVLQAYNMAYDIRMFSKEDVINLPIKIVGIAREKRTKID
ncbi:MAG TPA: helix-turn-helix domain-containing protein [Candidatus Onthousia faecavium]|nr:helix-turn-helix domain-containing protein [Candidatus Onthousia faecavium]